ncbi:Vi polysaccharide biosynthesis UDP-N-acetylglucosamine C-6 dehydrogenase TviB [Jannaschia sp. LMIT008]|uniref:Vi polysaccharide biosynthesis UDP-N-acetylglucosamine C-6 dehydrogenase TviB n=1 Tax=Jannaschia maritima TaxID=3032585 RepID=UPI002810D3D2|nr:Vi polysaccharide biosynthesis UDP-N-acetylglucosamine C-6 dehydrogenase TviB [Jannaschia sp. LMIT008]
MSSTFPPDATVAVVGLGYVGLPLAVEFGRVRPTVGFDIDACRIAALRDGRDATLEVSEDELATARHLTLADDVDALRPATVFVVTVPTPIDRYKRPDLGPLLAASRTVGAVLKRGDTVIYESTVYPGATEEDCVPVLEHASGLRFNTDFTVGYSPERINPGDKQHRLPDILKVTSGSTPEAAARIDALYREVVVAGTHRAPSIRVAEAAKVIENTQRDLNIALANELAVIFERLGIDTEAVLAAAGTKWNFLPFRPGLVGGHCIGVDPYYLTHRAQAAGHHPEIILAGRRLNDGMGEWVASRLVKAMLGRGIAVKGARVLMLGLTFKEDCPDIRNTRVIDVVEALETYGCAVDIHDPWADPAQVEAVLERGLRSEPEQGRYDAIVIAVAHRQFRDAGAPALRAFGRPDHVLFDLKYVLPSVESDLRM